MYKRQTIGLVPTMGFLHEGHASLIRRCREENLSLIHILANTASCCDTCTFYIYDDEYECYTCDRDLDEDEMMRFLTDQHYQCPYYRSGDEYRVVRKQM